MSGRGSPAGNSTSNAPTRLDAPTPLKAVASALSCATTTSMRGMIRVYQVTISPMLGERCRFFPSCSAYAMQALQTHGAMRGSWLSLSRLCKCHPWHPGGLDEVPPRRDRNASTNPLQ